MAPPLDLWVRSRPQSAARRGAIIAAVVLVVIAAWNVSSQDLVVVALAAAPAGAIGLLLARNRTGYYPMGDEDRSFVGGWDAFKHEVDRSRRHERPLALATARLPGEGVTGDDISETIARVRTQIRSIDVLWRDGSGLWVLMPESNRESATAAIGRIRDAAPATMRAVWRLVVFPEDALTVGDLIAKLERTAPVDLPSRPAAPPAS
jgi:hypothetical protein